MRAEDLLHDLRGKDIQLTVQGERLTYDAPAGVMTEALLALVRQHKAALLALLTQEDAEWHDERAAILEYEGGLSRAEADRQAPQHPGGLRLVDAAHPCLGCGSQDLVQHVTYRACAACGRELPAAECPKYEKKDAASAA